MKTINPRRVHVVVDPAFGQRLAALPADEPVWIVASPVNEPVARELWRQRSTKRHLDGITLFPSYGAPEDSFLGVLDRVDLHHGEHSATPPYSLLEVVGCAPSEGVRAALAELGFDVGVGTPDGFSASRAIRVV